MFDNDETQQCINKARSKRGEIFSAMRDALESWISAWYAVTDKQSWINEAEHGLQGVEKEVQRARQELAYRASSQMPQPAPVEAPTD